MAAFFVMEQNAGVSLSVTGAVIAYAFYFATTGLIVALVDALLKALEREAAALEELQAQRTRIEEKPPVSRW